MASQIQSPKPPASLKPAMPKPKLEKIISMNGGNGESSYDRTSIVQAYALNSLWASFSEAVHRMALPPSPDDSLRIADFGSSTGRNAFAYMDFLVKQIRHEYQHRRLPLPDFQAFFNDLPGNDFNTLFGLLPILQQQQDDAAKVMANAAGGCGRVREYFAAGVPGSFYGRLFPKASLHFAVSLHCLHWISQIPPEVTDPESELYNRGSCWIMGGKLATAQAYSEQSKADVRKFLKCRAVELAPGGILFCFFSGRADLNDPTSQTIPERRHRFMGGPDFENAWDDIIAEGIIPEETRDTFNLPLFCPHLEEMRESIAVTGAFDILKLERLEDLSLYPDESRMNLLQNPKKCAKFYSSWVRALVEPLMLAHMGSESTDELFVRYERRIAARCQAMLGDQQAQEDYRFLSADFLQVVLRRK